MARQGGDSTLGIPRSGGGRWHGRAEARGLCADAARDSYPCATVSQPAARNTGPDVYREPDAHYRKTAFVTEQIATEEKLKCRQTCNLAARCQAALQSSRSLTAF